MLGVRHQAHHVATLVHHSGDVACRAIRVLTRRIAEHDPAPSLEGVELLGRGEVAPGLVLDRDRQPFPEGAAAGERSPGALNLHLHLAGDEAQRFVWEEGTGQQARLAEHLEAVADA